MPQFTLVLQVETINMWRVSFMFMVLAVAYFAGLCQSLVVPDERQLIQPRFWGGLNRYYLHYWEQDSGVIRYADILNREDSINTITQLDGTQNVVILLHGRKDAAFNLFTTTLVDSIIGNDKEAKVIVVDWSYVADMEYSAAYNAVPFVADDIIALINLLATETDTTDDSGATTTVKKLDRELTHLVGFDIGAHIAGIVSRNSLGRVKKITGLSPARQSWDLSSRYLKHGDADFVEIIHTDYTGTSAMGTTMQTGTVNLFVNTGTAQPGCTNNQCNHDRAWQLFAANLDSGGHLVGLKCDDLTDMTRNLCTGFPAVMLGTNALDKNGEGIYRVNTGRVYPYNL